MRYLNLDFDDNWIDDKKESPLDFESFENLKNLEEIEINLSYNNIMTTSTNSLCNSFQNKNKL